jgi:hypothetical protein
MEYDLVSACSFATAALVYFHLMNYLDRRYARKKPFTDDEYLWRMARTRGCSEYDIFKISADQWHLSGLQADNDFKTYLRNLQMPHYVRDYIRKNKSEIFSEQPSSQREQNP